MATTPLYTMKVFLYLRDPAGTLVAGFDRIKVERSKDRGVTWTEITKEATRLIVEASRYNYYFVDDAAETTFLYRAVLSAVDGSPADVVQPPQQALDTSYEAVLTVEQLKQAFLFGIDLTNDDDDPFPDEMFALYLQAAMAQTEMELDINLVPKFFDQFYDFYRRDYENFCFVQLKEKPLISIEKVSLELGGQTIITFDNAWVKPDLHGASFQIYPGNSAIGSSFITQGGGYLPFIFGMNDYLPNLIHVQYFAGLGLGDARYLPLLREVVGKRAARGPLNTAGDLIAGAGIGSQSIGIDGLSRSVTTTNSSSMSGFGGRITMWDKEVAGAMKTLRRYFGGLKMTAV